MKMTEEVLKEIELNPDKYSDGVITPDGEYTLITEGHLKSLMALLPYSEKEIWKMVPEGDSALFWLIEQTGCVITDYNSSVGMVMTPEQEKTFQYLVEYKAITDSYFDISKRRKK